DHVELPRHHPTRPPGSLGGLAHGLSSNATIQVVELARQLCRRSHTRPEVGQDLGRWRGRVPERGRRQQGMTCSLQMSMVWMRMPEQTWFGATTSFLAMWVVMTIAMMLPCLVPMLWGYRQAVGNTGRARLGRLTVLVGVGYFFVWTMLGLATFP